MCITMFYNINKVQKTISALNNMDKNCYFNNSKK